jgi:hypothetical protein
VGLWPFHMVKVTSSTTILPLYIAGLRSVPVVKACKLPQEHDVWVLWRKPFGQKASRYLPMHSSLSWTGFRFAYPHTGTVFVLWSRV